MASPPFYVLKGEHADACEECGECEEKCPQEIPTMDQLREVAKTLGKWSVQSRRTGT